MSTMTLVIEFDRPVSDKDLACIGLGGMYIKTNKSKIGFDYYRVEKTRIGENWILFQLYDDDNKTFPDMVKLQSVLQEDGLLFDELNVEYDPEDIPPIYPVSVRGISFKFIAPPKNLPNGTRIEYQETKMSLSLSYPFFDDIHEKWAKDLNCKEKI